MTVNPLNPLAETLKVLSDPTRLRILEILHLRGETCVCELEAALDMTQSNTSFHVNTLKKVGLVTSRKIGKWVFYARDEAALKTCLDQLTALFSPERADAERLPDAAYARCQSGEISRAEILAKAEASVPDPV